MSWTCHCCFVFTYRSTVRVNAHLGLNGSKPTPVSVFFWLSAIWHQIIFLEVSRLTRVRLGGAGHATRLPRTWPLTRQEGQVRGRAPRVSTNQRTSEAWVSNSRSRDWRSCNLPRAWFTPWPGSDVECHLRRKTTRQTSTRGKHLPRQQKVPMSGESKSTQVSQKYHSGQTLRWFRITWPERQVPSDGLGVSFLRNDTTL